MKTKSKTASANDAENLPLSKDFFKRAQLGTMHVKPPRVEANRKQAERSKHMVGLDPEVAKVFKDSDSVNNVLRAIIGNLPQTEKKPRKSA